MGRVSYRCFLAVIFLLGLTPLVWAEGEVELDKIVVSANLIPQELRSVGQSINVLTRDEIQSKNILSVGDALQELPGVSVVSLGSPGDDLDIRFRGSDRDEVLVLLDGIPINNLTDARAQLLSSIPVDLIEKIEIIRGAQSVIYGSSAVGGVINIITDKGQEEGLKSLLLQAGNLGTFKETMAVSGKSGKHSYAASFSRYDRAGRFSNDRYGASNFFANYSFDFSERFRLQTSLYFTDHKQGLAFGSATTFAAFPTIGIYITRDQDRFVRRDVLIPQIHLEWDVTDFYTAHLSYGLYYEDLKTQNQNLFDPAPLDPTAALDSQDFNSRSHRHNFDLRHTFHALDSSDFKLDFVAGVSGQLEFLDFTDNPFNGDTTTKVASSFPGTGQEGSRRNIAGYGQAAFSWRDRVSLALGVRYDDNNTFGTAVSPRVSASYYHPKIKAKFFMGYSKGFIAPTLSQYYLAVIGGSLTQRLDKESSQTFEVGYHQEPLNLKSLGQISYGSTFFYTKYDTFINELQLVNNAHVIGVESFFKYEPVKWLEIAANYTYMQTINEADGSSLANRPRHQFHGDLKIKPIKNLSFVFDAEVQSNRLNPSVLSTAAFGDLTVATFDQNGVAAGASLPSYFVLNASARYHHEIGKSWLQELRYSFRVNNFLNKNYQLKYGYPMPRLNFLGGVEAVF